MSGGIAPSVAIVTPHVIDPDAERVLMVEQMMRDKLTGDQMHDLRDALETVFMDCGDDSDNERYLKAFVDAKRVENLSARSLGYYETTIRKCLAYIGKPVRFVDANDIRRCMAWALERGCSPVTANNERRCLSTFFQWLENEDIIRKSPVKRTKEMRTEKADKKPFSDEDVAHLRAACVSDRERALVELLLSSGMRVGELVGLDVADVDWNDRECEVLGKGRKRRTCYFSAEAKLYLRRYVDSRTDDCPALFVSKARLATRLSKGAVERAVRKLGARAGVSNVHPHRFRRTMATNNLRRGMPVEEIQQLLGHENVNTTLIYAKVDKEMLRLNARRLS